MGEGLNSLPICSPRLCRPELGFGPFSAQLIRRFDDMCNGDLTDAVRLIHGARRIARSERMLRLQYPDMRSAWPKTAWCVHVIHRARNRKRARHDRRRPQNARKVSRPRIVTNKKFCTP